MSLLLPPLLLSFGAFLLWLHGRTPPTESLAASASNARLLLTGWILVVAAGVALLVIVLQ